MCEIDLSCPLAVTTRGNSKGQQWKKPDGPTRAASRTIASPIPRLDSNPDLHAARRLRDNDGVPDERRQRVPVERRSLVGLPSPKSEQSALRRRRRDRGRRKSSWRAQEGKLLCPRCIAESAWSRCYSLFASGNVFQDARVALGMVEERATVVLDTSCERQQSVEKSYWGGIAQRAPEKQGPGLPKLSRQPRNTPSSSSTGC